MIEPIDTKDMNGVYNGKYYISDGVMQSVKTIADKVNEIIKVINRA